MAIVHEFECPYDDVTSEVQAIICETCAFTYRKWPDGPNACPQCVPGQPPPFGARRSDPTDFLGPDWVWVEGRGMRGLWCPKSEYVLVHRSEFEFAAAEVEPYKDDFEAPRSFLPQLAEYAKRYLAGEQR